MEILIAKPDAKDYTAIERMLIVSEGMRSDNVRSFINEYNISHDTFYTWKKNITEQANLIWGDKKSELKKIEAVEEKDTEIETLKDDIKKQYKEINLLSNELEKAKLKVFRAEMILNNISDELKEKMPLKRFRDEVVKEVEKLQHLNLEEACEALQIAVGTLRKWKREPHVQKKNQ